MTDDEIHSALVRWLAALLGVTVIKDHQGGTRPPQPYVVANFTGSAEVRQHPQIVEYTDTGVPNSEGENEISAAPVLEVEWRFSVHAYGAQPTGWLRPVRSAVQLAQRQEPLLPGLVIHEISQIRSVPDWVNNAWEPRAQMDVVVRGLTRDGLVIDVIDQTSFEFERV